MGSPITPRPTNPIGGCGISVGVLLFGGVFCHLFAPETSQERLAAVTPDEGDGKPEERPLNAH